MVYNSWRLPPKAAMSAWLRVVVQTKRNGGSENQSRRISNKRVETVCSATAFFLCRRPAEQVNFICSNYNKVSLQTHEFRLTHL